MKQNKPSQAAVGKPVAGSQQQTSDDALLQVPCPRCGQVSIWGGNPHKPFCSERCKQIDLGDWADNRYVIAGTPAGEMTAELEHLAEGHSEDSGDAAQRYLFVSDKDQE